MSVNLKALIHNMASDANLWLGELQLPYAKRFVRQAVRQFYAGYHPRYYHRHFSLNTMAKFVVSNKPFQIMLGGEFSSSGHRVDEGYIYENSFKRGFHGGAINGPGHPSAGTPLWRKPHPEYTFWGHKATQSAAPFDTFMGLWNGFVAQQGPQLKTVVLNRIIQKYVDQLVQYFNEQGGR